MKNSNITAKRPQILATITEGLIFYAIRAGFDPRILIPKIGLTIESIEEHGNYIDFANHQNLFREIHSGLPSINVGLQFGAEFTTKRLGIVGGAIEHAATFGQVLQDIVLYHQLITDMVSWHLLPDAQGQRVILLGHPMLPEDPSFIEAGLAMLIAVGRQLTGEWIQPLRVSFRHAPSGTSSEYQTFFGAPVQFRADADEVVFAQTTFDLSLPQADPILREHSLKLVQVHHRTLTSLKAVSAVVRQHLLSTLQREPPRKGVIAKLMGITPRTMSRRLHDEGTSFEAVLDQTRRELALQYLTDPSLSIYKIGCLLGYTEQSTFFRMFRRWFGCTPKEYRSNRGRESLLPGK